MSRKLIFAAGLITCYSCDPDWVAQRDSDIARQPTVDRVVEYLLAFVHRRPLDIIAGVLGELLKKDTPRRLMDTYEEFLARLDDRTTRKHLQKLPPENAEKDKLYAEIQDCCGRFEKALEDIFFDEHPHLARLTRKYGVF